MISAVQIRNFRGIKATHRVELSSFHVLVGPNGSGKSTFLDALEFVRDCLREGPLRAVEQRVPEFRDLTFMRGGGPVEFDLWLDLSQTLPDGRGSGLHYRLVIAEDRTLGVCVSEESLKRAGRPKQKEVTLLGKTSNYKDFYRRETGTYVDHFLFGRDKLGLSLTPPDDRWYPTGTAVKVFLMEGIRYVQLNSRDMRWPSAATRPTELELDGTNLARVVGRLYQSESPEDKEAFRAWTNHLQYALEDLESIGWAKRQADNAEYVVLRYRNGLECPSWLLSDGTLRLLALTLPAFLPAKSSVYMIEEPENGVHPKALEIIIKALGGIRGAQVFVATHSPLVVQEVGLDSLLCFGRGESGVYVVSGNKHPRLVGWTGEPDLATIFASRVLG